jgi:hypothetical protein
VVIGAVGVVLCVREEGWWMTLILCFFTLGFGRMCDDERLGTRGEGDICIYIFVRIPPRVEAVAHPWQYLCSWFKTQGCLHVSSRVTSQETGSRLQCVIQVLLC